MYQYNFQFGTYIIRILRHYDIQIYYQPNIHVNLTKLSRDCHVKITKHVGSCRNSSFEQNIFSPFFLSLNGFTLLRITTANVARIVVEKEQLNSCIGNFCLFSWFFFMTENAINRLTTVKAIVSSKYFNFPIKHFKQKVTVKYFHGCEGFSIYMFLFLNALICVRVPFNYLIIILQNN